MLISTDEGQHTKTVNCKAYEAATSMTEYFVTRMSSLVNQIELTTNVDGFVKEASKVLESDVFNWEEGKIKDFVKSIDLNQAVTTALTKTSIDDEILYFLKSETDNIDFNMFELNMSSCVWKR
jgi:hypothetical protein